MKITTNSIGNYGLNTVKNTNAVKRSEKVTDKIDINKTERKFFAKMYPSEKEKVMNYHFYNKNGKFGGVAIGNNIDLRG